MPTPPPPPCRAERDDSVPIVREMQPFRTEPRGIVARMAGTGSRRPRGLGRIAVFALLAAAGTGARGARRARRLERTADPVGGRPDVGRRVRRGAAFTTSSPQPGRSTPTGSCRQRVEHAVPSGEAVGSAGGGGKRDRAHASTTARPSTPPRCSTSSTGTAPRRPSSSSGAMPSTTRADAAHGRVGPRDRQPHLVARVADRRCRRRARGTTRWRARTTSSAAPSGTSRGCSARPTARCGRARTARCAGPGCCPSSGASTPATTTRA